MKQNVLLIGVLLSAFFIAIPLSRAADTPSRFKVEVSNLQLIINGKPSPYQSMVFKPSDYRQGVSIEVTGKMRVLGGDIQTISAMREGGGSASWEKRFDPKQPDKDGVVSWRGNISLRPGESTRVSVVATGFDKGNTRETKVANFPESVIHLDYSAASAAPLQVEFSEVQLWLNGKPPVPFASREILSKELHGNQVGFSGKMKVKEGEVLYLNLIQRDGSSYPLLQKNLPPGPLKNGEFPFSGTIPLNAGESQAVSLQAVAYDPNSSNMFRQGASFFYPASPVVLQTKEYKVSPFKMTITSRRLGVDSTSTGSGKLMEWTDISKDGLIYETDKNSIFNVFAVNWTLDGGKVTKVEYTKDGTNWVTENSLSIDPATGAIVGISESWNAKPGDSFNLAVRVTGVDVDQDGNAVSAPRMVVDNISAKLLVKTLPPFTASFKRLYIEAGDVKSDFKALPAPGIKITSQEAVPVMLTAEWTVTSGKLLKVSYSTDGGRNWTEAEKRTGPNATQAAVSAAPGQNLDIVFKLQGQNAGPVPGEITDPAHARISVEKPKTIPLDAGFANQAFYEEGGGAPLKNFSELAGKVFEYTIARSPARLEAQVTWWKKTGILESVGVSYDGGKRWQTTLMDPTKNFWKVSVLLSPNETQDIVFQLLGYDQDAEGRRVGPLKTITDTLHGKISGKAADVPFQAVFKNQSIILSGKAMKFADLPAEGFSYTLDPKNPKISIKTSFEFKGYLTILAVSKDGGATEWDSVVFQPGQATGEHTFELPVASGENLDLVFRIEGFDVDPWDRPKGQHKLITDTQHGKIKVIPPPVSTFHDQGLGIGNDSIMFSKIPPEGLRLSSALPVPIYAWSELAVKGSRVKKGFFSTDGGKNWQAFQSISNSSISGDIGKAQPGQTLDIVFKIEQAPLDANGNESGPPTELIDENHARVEIVPPSGFDAAVDFSHQEIRIGDKIFPLEKIDPVQGLVFESSAVVRLDMSASISIPAKNAVAKNGAIFNGQDTVAFNALNNKREGRIMGYLYPAPGQTLDLAFVCEVQGMDAAGKPILGAVKAVRDTLQRKITIRKPIAHPFKAEFTEKTVKIGGETKSFSGIPAAGWVYEMPDLDGTADYTVSWRLDSGYLKEVLCSTDGGTTWLNRVIGDGEHPDTHTFQVPFKTADAPGNSHQVVCALKGVDADDSGKEVSGLKTLTDEQTVKINFVKTAKPEVELTNIKINGEPLEDIPPVIPMEEIKDGEVHITGNLHSNALIDHLKISFDGGGKWEDVEAKPEWSYDFKPELDHDYEVKVLVVLKDGTEVEPKDYPRNHFRFVGSAVSAEDAQEVLNEMARAYENKDYSAFMARVSDDFPNHGELEEFIRRDFRDFDGVKINLYFKNKVDTPQGPSVQIDWEMRYSTADSASIVVKGEDLSFIFTSEGGRLKLQNMRGANPLFGARSPEIAVASGVSISIGQTLQKIEDEGSKESKVTALNIVASEVQSSQQVVPVTFEIVEAFAHYTDGALEEVDFEIIQTGRPLAGEARIRITDNPTNVDFTGLQLEITDSLSGDRLTFTGDVRANQEVVFRTTDLIIFDPADAGKSGRLTFVLDPAEKFIAIDREQKTVRQDYTLV